MKNPSSQINQHHYKRYFNNDDIEINDYLPKFLLKEISKEDVKESHSQFDDENDKAFEISLDSRFFNENVSRKIKN